MDLELAFIENGLDSRNDRFSKNGWILIAVIKGKDSWG